MRKILILTTALAVSACTAEGRVDWDKVGLVAGATVAVIGAVALGAAVGAAAAQPTYYQPTYYVPPAPITCYSNRFGNQVTTNCY